MPSDWVDALGTRANGLPLPAGLADMLASGRWASASETNFRLSPWGGFYAYSLGGMRSETESVCLQMRWLGKRDPDHPPGDIDPRLTVLIGDEGLGSDAPYALDYRTSFGRPRVLAYRWRNDGNRWLEVTAHFGG